MILKRLGCLHCKWILLNINVYGLAQFCNCFRKDMILSDGVIFVASRTRFGSAQAGRAGKGAPQFFNYLPFVLSRQLVKCCEKISNRSSTNSKHIDIKFLIVKERVESDQLSIKHIGTNSVIVDLLTKGLPPKVFHENTAHMSVVSIDDM